MLRHLTYANVMATIAFMLALGGSTAVAASLVTGKDVQDGSLTGRDIADGSVRAVDLAGRTDEVPLARESEQPTTAPTQDGGLRVVMVSGPIVRLKPKQTRATADAHCGPGQVFLDAQADYDGLDIPPSVKVYRPHGLVVAEGRRTTDDDNAYVRAVVFCIAQS